MLITPAYAQTAGGGDMGAFLIQLVPFIAIIAVFYFLIIRPQQQRMKKHAELVGSVRRGDIVVTSGGLIGKVTRVFDGEGEIEVEVSPNVRVRVVRSTLADVRSKGEPANDDKPS